MTVKIVIMEPDIQKASILKLYIRPKTTWYSVKRRLLTRFTMKDPSDCIKHREAVQEMFKGCTENQLREVLWDTNCPENGRWQTFVIGERQCLII